ncbi:hypothetical protein B1M_28291, partial [Burkholderia sp. TJI49]
MHFLVVLMIAVTAVRMPVMMTVAVTMAMAMAVVIAAQQPDA